MLLQLIGNLLENAARYNVESGWITAVVTRTDGEAVITVANSGPVLSLQMATEIFQPFKHGTAVRTRSAEGSGLGLSIVATIASALGGRVQARPLVNGGLEVSVTLPAVATSRSEPALAHLMVTASPGASSG